MFSLMFWLCFCSWFILFSLICQQGLVLKYHIFVLRTVVHQSPELESLGSLHKWWSMYNDEYLRSSLSLWHCIPWHFFWKVAGRLLTQQENLVRKFTQWALSINLWLQLTDRSLSFLCGLRGYHKYPTPTLHKVLPTVHERSNRYDRYAIAAKKVANFCATHCAHALWCSNLHVCMKVGKVNTCKMFRIPKLWKEIYQYITIVFWKLPQTCACTTSPTTLIYTNNGIIETLLHPYTKARTH